MTLRTVLWNLEWATPCSARGRYLKNEIEAFDPDIICLTESVPGMLPYNGYSITSAPDYGYGIHSQKRKVLLWSKEPWVDVQSVGVNSIPSGRFVSGITKGIRIVGVCIPWNRAHVSTGRRDRKPWQDHLAYLEGLKEIVERLSNEPEPLVLLGDFNQRIPKHRQPEAVYAALQEVLSNNMRLGTEGVLDPEGHLLLDHVATGTSVTFEIEEIHASTTKSGLKLSDHAGIFGNLRTI